MDESESKADSDGNTSQNGGATPQNIVKPKRRSLVERELETNLTARVTSPVASGEAKGTTSRYGRSRRLKTHSEFCESDKAVTAMFKSSMNEQTPSKSPAYKMNASNSKRESPKTPIMETTSNIEHQIENIMSNNANLSRFSTAESNDKSPTKKFSKIYTRKDLIQSKEKEETVSIMKNMFSPTKSSYKASTNTHLSNILERSSEKYNLNVTETKPNGYKDTLSVVKTLDFDMGKKKKPQESAANNTISKSELFEREAKSEYQVGDLAWSRVGTYPFWPCIITRDPFSGIFVKKKLFGRVERDVFHVTFFGDNGRRGWIVDNMLRRYQGLEEFEATRDGFTPQSKKKDPRLYSAFFVSDKKRHSWDVSVQEAEILMREPKRFRIDALNEMLSKTRVMKTTPKRQRSEKIVRTDSDVSLSESLYDTLFSEDDTKGEELDKSKNKPRKKSLDVSDVVTACLDNMAAKTGISKIQKQSHMDRWLQKAKSKTPEKIQNVFGPTKSRNELKGSHSGKRSRKTPLKDQRTLILKNKCGGNDSDCLGMLRITTAFQLNDHDYTKLDTENANPENNQNRNTQDNNIIIVNGVVTDKSCGIGIISKVESLYNRSMSEDKTTETFDIENNMTVAGEELIVTETDETTVRTDDKGLKVSEHKTDAQEQISDNIQNIMDVDFQDISIKNQDKMDVDTPESVEDNSQKDLVNAEGPQTSEKTMRSNNEGLQNRESPSYRVTRRSKRLSLDPKTKIKSSEVTDGKIYGDISFENKSNENNKNMKSSKSLEKSASKKNKNIINVGDKPSENEIQEKTKDNLSKYDIEIKLESRTNSDHITNGVRDNLSGSSCHTNKGDLLDDKYVNLTRNDSKTIEKSTKNDSFTKVANIAVSSDVSKILEDFSEMDDDSQLGDVRVTLPEPMPVNGDINHVHIEKVTTKDEVIENSDQNSPIEVNKPLNREDIMDRNGDVNHDEESTELVADTTQSLVVKKSPKLVLSNGDLETDAESLHDKSTKCTDIKDVEDVGLKQQMPNESPEIELTPLEEIFAAQLEEAKQNNRKSKNSQEIKKDYVLHSNTLIHEALDINEFNCDVKKPLETEDVQNLDKEHSEPMEVNDDAPESAIESDETARDALDDVENSSEPESPMYEETLLVEEPNNIEIVCNSGSIEQTNHKNNTEIGQDKNMSASSEPRTYSYDDKLVTLKEFKVKVTRMPMESFQNNLVSLKEKESFQQNPVKPTEKEPLQENLPERTEKAESQKNLEKPLEGRPLQKNLAEVAEKVPLQNNFDGPIEKETLDKNSDEASKRETLQQNSEEDTKLGKNIGTNDIPQKNGELLEKETILSNLEKTTQLTATSDQKSDTVEETVVKSECGSTDSDFEDNISIAAMCRSYSEESRESKSAQNSTKECAKPKRKPSKDKNTTQPRMEMHQALENPEFLKYIELRQDALIDENPHVTEDEVVEYLFKTWLYSENLKSETVKSFDKEQSTLVKGLGDEPPPQPKKIRKKIKVEKEKEKEPQSTEEIVPKDRSKRKVARAYYNENDTDLEEELQVFEIFKMVNKQPAKPKGENAESPNTDAISMEEEKEKPEPDNYIVDEVEMFFSQLAKPKPNVFKGIPRERLCEICERPGSLIKCKGLCGGMFHLDCVRREIEAPPKTDGPNRTRKRKKPRGRKPKNLDDSGSQSDDKKDLNLSDETIADEIQLENNLVIDADNFESQLEAKMQEMLKTELPADYDYSSEEELQWNDTATGKCEIVEVKLKLKRPENEYGEFKCNGCLKNEIPVCFVCKSTTSPKNSVELRQKCQTAHCHKYYHLECLDVWPQTQFSGGEPSRNNKKISETFEALTCPRHVCHTCVCDDPRGCNTRFSGDKLARCVRCPATYHSFNKCLPAGSTILSASHIVCPRHYEHRPGKIPCHVNTGWCFICALGGTLICCEYCPTSFHAECLNIKPPEGNYMCEDCETGRLPLYGEMMWVKLGHYRWWPGIILHPCEIPANIMAVRHSSGEFVVRFFGQYDHYWVNRGRVFPFLEGDSGKLSGQKSKIDEAFTMAMEHAQRACEILKNAAPNEEEDTDIASSLLPPHYVKLKVNKPCGALVNYKLDDEENSLTLCECDPNDIEPCGPDTHCLNRMLLTECGPTCRAGDRCRNRAFEMRAYPKLTHYRTSWGGWGLKTLEPIRQGQFVIEYVGELLDEAEFRRRMQRKHETRDENYYFLTLDRDRMIDAGPKGNLARFMNHCCEPNCETQKWTVLGDVRVGLFALRDIPANSEVTFNYNLECAGIEKKPCLCGAKRCSGYIGAKPKQEEAQPKKSKLHTKRPYKKRKPNVENSPSTSKTKVVKPRMTQRSRPKEVKELTEIEKDLLIIKNATNGLSSDSETCARLSSVDTEKLVKDDSKPLKRKRVSFSKDEVVLCNGDVEHSPSAKKVKLETLSGVGD